MLGDVFFILFTLFTFLSPISAQNSLSSCDPLVREYCMLPFPNNFYLEADNTTQTGFRLRITPEGLPVSDKGESIDPVDWLHRDGFARALPASTLVLGLSLETSKLPRHWDIGESLISESPSILLDADTGEVLPHWTELDNSTPEGPLNERILMLWPIVPLPYGHRFIVGLRNLKREDGSDIEASEAFAQLRDNIPSGDYDIESRRENYENNIFPLLQEAGFERKELFIAWDFTVSSEQNTRNPLRHMVKDALTRVPSNGPNYRILSVRDDVSEVTARFIYGSYRVASYLENDKPGSKLVFGDDGLPVFQREVWVPFSLTIPRSLATGEKEPQGIIQFGHGLFQNHLVVLTPELQNAADHGGAILYATNMKGMSAEDVPAITAMLSTDLSDASIIPNGCMQGVVNYLVLTKLMLGEIGNDERVMFNNKSMINTEKRGYIGYSQGGIYGPTVISLSEDINYGVFGVPGTPFVLLLPRANPFNPYWQIICSRYSNPIDRITLLSYIQIIWDHVDSVGYVDLLAENSNKMTQFVWAKGDAQVTYLGHNLLARGAKAKLFRDYITSRDNETMYGFDISTETEVYEGNVAIGYEFGVPEVPITNTPPNKDTDTHNDVYKQMTFVDRCLTLFYDFYHKHNCDGPCGFDPEK